MNRAINVRDMQAVGGGGGYLMSVLPATSVAEYCPDTTSSHLTSRERKFSPSYQQHTTSSYECGQVFIGPTSIWIETRTKDQHWHIRSNYPDKSKPSGA